MKCIIAKFSLPYWSLCISRTQLRLNLYVFPEHNNSCQVEDKVVQNGSTWRKNDCTECRCKNGVVFCDERNTYCPELPESCQESVVPPGSCCPICVGMYTTMAFKLTFYVSYVIIFKRQKYLLGPGAPALCSDVLTPDNPHRSDIWGQGEKFSA